MVPPWLHSLAIASLAGTGLCALVFVVDLMRRPQRMWIMNVVWPVTALYLGPIALWLYFRYGRERDPVRGAERKPRKPFWAITAIGVTHCGAGCTLGDIVAEFGLFFAGAAVAGSFLDAAFLGDYVLAYLLGIAFQYFAIAPMRGISGVKGIWAAVKADTLSLTAFEVGLFLWMWWMSRVFHPELKPDDVAYWFSMQIGMALGFLTAYPMNWWLIAKGVKEAM